MIKTIFSLTLPVMILSGAVLAVAQSAEALARQDANASVKSAAICSSLDTLEERSENKLATHMAKALEEQIKRDKKIKAKREVEAKNLAKKQLEWQERREENYQKLQTIATSENDKAQLVEFQVAAKQATATKKIAIDQALADFRDAVDTLLLERNEAGNDAVESYKSLINHSFDRARSSCVSEDDATQIKESLRVNLEQAKADYLAAIQHLAGRGQQVKELAQIKNTAIRQAVENFKATLQAERGKLNF